MKNYRNIKIKYRCENSRVSPRGQQLYDAIGMGADQVSRTNHKNSKWLSLKSLVLWEKSKKDY